MNDGALLPAPARALATLLILAASLTLVLTAADSAHAHSDVVATHPAAGAVVSDDLTAVSVQFATAIDDTHLDAVLVGPAGSTRLRPAATASLLTAPVDDLDRGEHTFRYRAVGIDGHVVVGELSFRVGGSDRAGLDGALGADGRVHPSGPTVDRMLAAGLLLLLGGVAGVRVFRSVREAEGEIGP